jgi:hypothetical protein
MEAEMKPILMLALAGFGIACTTSAPVELSQSQQALLDEALAGRTAGPPVACVNQRLLRGNRTFGEGVILFEAAGGILYVNRPAGGCPGLQFGRTLVMRSTIGQMCRGDIASVLDPVSGTEFGGCGLGDFVPYRRAP